MEYKSARSEQFKKWLKAGELTDAKIALIVEAEKQARVMAHLYQLTGDIDSIAAGKVDKAVEALRLAYEETE